MDWITNCYNPFEGGYVVDLYLDNDMVMTVDVISDGWLSRQTSGILSHSDHGTLAYSNLNRLEDVSDDWKTAYQRYDTFASENDMTVMPDSLKAYKNVFIFYHAGYDGAHNIRCL